MEINLILESKNFEHDKDIQKAIESNPCYYCLFGSGLMCVERKYCRCVTYKEIYVKKKVKVIK